MIKVCKNCGKKIEGKPKIYDEYYFCNTECVRGYEPNEPLEIDTDKSFRRKK